MPKRWKKLLLLLPITLLFSGHFAPDAPEKRTPAVIVKDSPAFKDIQQLIKSGKYADAEKMARELLARTEAAAGQDSLETAAVLDKLGNSLWRAGKVKDGEAEALLRRSLSIKERALGPDDPSVADTLEELSGAIREAGQFAQTRPILERILTIRKKAFGEMDVRVGDAQFNLGALARKLYELDVAESHYRKALAIYERTDGRESENAASALDGLGSVLTQKGRFEEAEGFYQQSLQIRERVHGPKHRFVAFSCNNLGNVHREMGEYEKAHAELKRAVRIKAETLGEAHPQTILSLANVAMVEASVGLDAQSTWERAIALADQSVGPQHELAATLRANYTVFLGAADPVKASRLLEQAAPALARVFGPDHPETFWVLELLGDNALRLGDTESASRYLERAVAGYEKKADAETGQWSSALKSLANCRVAQARFSEAQSLYNRALTLSEKTYGTDHPAVAGVLLSLGDLLRKMGDSAGARAAYTRALSIKEKSLGPAHQETAGPLVALADLEAEAGHFSDAKQLFQRGIGVLEKTGGLDHPSTGEAHQRFAACLLKAGETGQALREALQAEAVLRRHLRLSLSGLPERQALSYAKKTASGLGVAMTAAALLDDPASSALVLDAVIRSRALVLDEMGKRHQTAWAENEPGVKQLFDPYAAARDKLANLTVRGPDEKYPEKFRVRLERARADKEAAERALAEKCAGFRRSQLREEAGLTEISAALPTGSALVTFVRYAPQEAGRKAQDPADAYAALVLRPGSKSPALVPLGPAKDMDREVATVRRVLSEGAELLASNTRLAESSYQRSGSVLRRLVWDPIEQHLKGARVVFLVPDGSLQLVNFAALPAGPSTFVLEDGSRIHYLSAERDLIPADLPTGAGLLAAGGPDYDAALTPAAPRAAVPSRAVALVPSHGVFRGERPRCTGFESLRFPPLRAARLEVEDAAAAWRQAKTASETLIVLEGASANELAVKTNAPGKHALHLATHAYFLGDCPRPDSPMAKTFSENPLLLSGLAFAGANRRAESQPDVDDGILTAEEVAALDLSGVAWAVLSACDTGAGEVRAGESLFGLRRAFQIAGARTVIMSLWPVEDKSSRDWMKALYRNRLEKRMTTIDAVHEASLERLDERRARGKSTHPIFWAGFVAAGEWR